MSKALFSRPPPKRISDRSCCWAHVQRAARFASPSAILKSVLPGITSSYDHSCTAKHKQIWRSVYSRGGYLPVLDGMARNHAEQPHEDVLNPGAEDQS